MKNTAPKAKKNGKSFGRALENAVIRPIKNCFRQIFYKLRYPGKINIGPRTKISSRAILRLEGGRIKIGSNVRVMDNAMLLSSRGSIEIGDDCSVNPFCVLYGQGGLKIGKGVRIAAHTVIIPSNHTFDDIDTPIWKQPETKLGIEIGDDVWIGAGCRILDGVKIGKGCVVGAGAVVTKSLPEYSIAVGVPARIIDNRKDQAKAKKVKSDFTV